MVRFILLEGWDEVGKTTLARYLCSNLNLPYVHVGAPTPGGEEDALEHHRLVNLAGAVVDRGWWSNRIYAPLVEGREPMSLETVRWLELAAAGGVLIRVDCDPATLEARLQHRDAWSDLLPPYEALEHVRATLEQTRMPRRRRFIYWTGRSVSPGQDPFGTLITRPEELLAELRLLSRAYPGWRAPGIGNPYLARAALVGERHPRGLRPFERSRSGAYLLRALERLAWTTDDLYITNATHDDVADELRYLTRNEVPIVALGAEAEAALRRVGVTASLRKHPQFWARFRYDRLEEYAERLAESLGFPLTGNET